MHKNTEASNLASQDDEHVWPDGFRLWDPEQLGGKIDISLAIPSYSPQGGTIGE